MEHLLLAHPLFEEKWSVPKWYDRLVRTSKQQTSKAPQKGNESCQECSLRRTLIMTICSTPNNITWEYTKPVGSYMKARNLLQGQDLYRSELTFSVPYYIICCNCPGRWARIGGCLVYTHGLALSLTMRDKEVRNTSQLSMSGLDRLFRPMFHWSSVSIYLLWSEPRKRICQ